MQKVWDKLRDRNGGSLMLGIFVTFFMVSVFLAIFLGVRTYATAATIQTAAQQVLNSYTDAQGRKAEESIKSGTDHTITLDQDGYTEQLQQALGTGSSNTRTVSGRVRYVLTDIALIYTTGNEIDSTANIQIHIPLYWDNTEITVINLPITARCKYEGKG